MERLKFYADTPRGDKNKFFCWKIDSILDLEKRLLYWMEQGYYIRAAWYEYVDEETGEKQNDKIDLIEFCESKAVFFTKKFL